jgi:DnaJ-domain-containing protein 1
MSANEIPLNPLLPAVLRLLRGSALQDGDRGVSEYELLKALEADGVALAPVVADADLHLFQRHFLLMNALYRLQDLLWREEQVWLTISPLRIVIESSPGQASKQALGAAENTALRDYYLDWREFEATDGAAVATLLDSFWQRLHAHDGRAAALATLELHSDASWDEVRRQYRRLAASTHPDRGGDGGRFLAVREAYEVLRHARGATAR